MITIRWKILALNEGTPLCVTCTWGVVRKGYRAGEEETFCRMIVPNGRVPFPVSECTGYIDRRAPDPGSGRCIGFAPAEALREAEGVESVPAAAEEAKEK